MDEAERDLEVDDLFEMNQQEKQRKKPVNSKGKGDRTEINFCKMFEKQFGPGFSKAPSSGARTKQVKFLPEHAIKTLTGDICVPEGFLWVIECKGGYEDKVKLDNILKPIPQLETWIEQSTTDARFCGRMPIIVWKRNNKPWLTFVETKNLGRLKFDHFIRYGDWTCIELDQLLEKTKRTFWFSEEAK